MEKGVTLLRSVPVTGTLDKILNIQFRLKVPFGRYMMTAMLPLEDFLKLLLVSQGLLDSNLALQQQTNMASHLKLS